MGGALGGENVLLNGRVPSLKLCRAGRKMLRLFLLMASAAEGILLFQKQHPFRRAPPPVVFRPRASTVLEHMSEDTSKMEMNNLVLKKEWTVSDSLVRMRRLRRIGDKSTSSLSKLGRAWVVERNGRLVGYVGATELLLSDPTTKLTEILKVPFVVNATDELDEALIALRAADVAVAPVVDENGTLVASFSPSDVIATLEAEATEDVVKMATSGGIGDTYFADNVASVVKNRAAWLLSLLMLQSVSSTVLNKFSALLGSNILLTLFLTTLTGTAGNAGGQTSAVVIRALATGQIDSKVDSFKVMRRELRLAIPLAIVLGSAAFLRVIAIAHGKANAIRTALTIAAAMSSTVVAAVLVGTGAPLFLDRIRIDPCNCASPVLATFVDIAGVLILCTIGTVLLPVVRIPL